MGMNMPNLIDPSIDVAGKINFGKENSSSLFPHYKKNMS